MLSLCCEQEPDSDNEAQGTRRGATPSMSQRVADAAQTAKETVQDTLTSAIDQGREHLPFNWPALLGLLLLTLLAGHGLSTLLRPHYKSDDISFFNRSIDQANHRYKQLGDYVAKTEGKLKDTEHRCVSHSVHQTDILQQLSRAHYVPSACMLCAYAHIR